MEILNNDTDLVLFDFPLDYEIISFRGYYHDPSIPKDKITWQYSVVNTDYSFPNVKYEILEELYLPSETETKLENLSLQLTGHIEEANLTTKKARYYPYGHIYVEDDVTNDDVPLENVKVKIRNWFTVDVTTTNSYGYFTSDKKFGGKVDIIVQFESSKCKLRSTLINIGGTADAKLADEVENYKVVICKGDRNTSSNPLPSGFASYKDTKVWAWATTLKAMEEYFDFCSTEGIGLPNSGLRVWVNRNSGDKHSGAAPMFHRGWGFYKINGDV